MSTWLINDSSPESYGLTVVGGTFRSGRASSVQLSRNLSFDENESPFTAGTAVVIKRDGSPFFRGKVRQIAKAASGSSEGQDFLVEDVWAELELLTYQEPWAIRQADYTGIAYSPTVVLGMNSAGTRINVGQQIAEVLTFAVAQGLSLTAGTMPTGMMLWPSEVNGMSCADVIRNCLQFYPDWIPWIDHSTSPPTFKVTPSATAEAVSLAVTDCTNFRITKTQDRVPAGVRIVYLTASVITVDGEANVFRSMTIDQFPTVSDAVKRLPAGPGILVTTVDLAGTKTNITKHKVKTRHIPTSLDDEVLSAKEYLKEKYPQLRGIADDKFTLADWTRTAILNEGDEPEDLDPKLPRLLATTLAKMPRELVNGTLPEAAQRYVGQVRLKFAITAESDATAAERKVIESIPDDFVIRGTNATTKKYSVVTSYTAGDPAMFGVAQAFYETLVKGCYYEGSATLHGAELSTTLWHGAVLNLTGGVSAWATMKAPIHAVSWDLETCETVLDFGPNPEFSFQDFMEFLKLLNRRENTEYTIAERSGERIGDEDGISANGDLAGGYDGPETITLGGRGAGSAQPFELVASGTAGDNILKVRESTLAGAVPAGFTAGIKEFTIADAAGVVYAKLTINGTTGAVTARAIEKATSMPADTATVYHEQIGSYTVTGSGGSAVISATNTRYGPIPATICRNWFAAEAPFYAVSFG